MGMNDRDDRIRTSDADRERITARLRDHFAEGRLTREELDERITATLSSRTFGDLRHIMADLPEPAPALTLPRTAIPGPVFVRRGPRLLPLAMLFLVMALLVVPGGGFVFFALLQLVLVFWLLAGAAALFAVARFRRRMRHYWQLTQGPHQSWGYPL